MTPSGQQPSPGARLVSVLRVLVLVASAGYVALYLALAAMRVGYPFELEWLEGAMVDHVRRILAGQPLYAKPSLAFIPLTYTPGYFYLGALVSRLLGVGFLPLRLISIAGSLAVLGLLYTLAARETRDPLSGVLAAGLFAALYGWTDGWLDLARTDSLLLALALVAVYLLRWRPSAAGALGAGVAIGLAFLVKQTGLIIGLPLLVYACRLGPRRAAICAAAVVAIVGGSTLLLQRVSDGWYLYYVTGVPAQHPLALSMLWGFWRFDLLRPLPIALTAAAAYLAWLAGTARWARAGFLAAASAGLFAGALASRLHSMSYVNVVLPAYAAVALVAAVATAEFSERWRGRGVLLAAAPYVLALAQLGRLIYSPASLIPTADDVAAGEALLTALAGIDGRVFVPHHGYLPVRAGKPSNAHAVVIADVIRGGTTEVERGLAVDLDAALRNHAFAAVVVVDGPTPTRAWLPIERDYRVARTLVTRRSRFWRGELLLVPRP